MSLYKPQVSIIVPVFNAEKYLRRCIDSIIHQTYQNIEVILIDDCSTDSSNAICKDYEAKYEAIVVVENTVNKGVSFSRNRGLSVASGEFIIFVDSDDYIEPDYVEYFVGELLQNSSDIEIISFVREFEDGQIIFQSNVIQEKTFILDDDYDFSSFYAHRGVWGVAFKRTLLNNTDGSRLQFYNSIAVGEDLLFLFNLMLNSKKCHFSSGYSGYHYVVYRNSSYFGAKFQKMYDNIKVYKQIINILNDMQFSRASISAKKRLVYKCEELIEVLKHAQDNDSKEVDFFKIDYRTLTWFALTKIKSWRFRIKWIWNGVRLFL